jgi:hypothetical protein
MKYELFHFFTENFEVEGMDLQVVIMTKLHNKMIQFTFRGESDQIHAWLSEVHGEVVFIEIRKLYDITQVLTYGVPYNGEIYKFERNSLDLETEHLSYE